MMGKHDLRDPRSLYQRKNEVKKKSRSLPPYNRHGEVTIDHKAIFAAYEREEKEREQCEMISSLSSDTSCSSVEFLKPNEINESKMVANDSSSSVEKRNHSTDSLNRKERLEALKARVEAERLKYGESSSDDEKKGSKRLPRYHSDEAIHHISRDHSRSRSARTERYLKRRSQDESALLKNYSSRKPPAGRSNKIWQEASSPPPPPPAPVVKKPVTQDTSTAAAPLLQANPVLTPLNVVTASVQTDSNLCHPSPNDSGVSTQSIASSPSIGRAPSPPKRMQDVRLMKNEISSKMRVRNFSPSDHSRSSSDIRSERSVPSPVSSSPIPRIHSEAMNHCCRMSISDAENCNKKPMPLMRPPWHDCCCHANRVCCAVPIRFIPNCSSSHMDCNRKAVIYSYTDQAPRYSANSTHVKRMISRLQRNENDKNLKLNSVPNASKPTEINCHSPTEVKVPCPVHLTRSELTRIPSTLPNKLSGVEFHSGIPRLCTSVEHVEKSPISANCRPLSMVMDTLDYLTNPDNYTKCPTSPIKTPIKPSPPIPPIRKYHWIPNLNPSNSKLEDALRKTRKNLTSPDYEYKSPYAEDKQFTQNSQPLGNSKLEDVLKRTRNVISPEYDYKFSNSVNKSFCQNSQRLTNSKLENVSKKTHNITSPAYKLSNSENKLFSQTNEPLNSVKTKKNESTENLDQALKELEEIYQSLKLNDDDLVDRAERRDLPVRHQQQIFSPHSPTLQRKDENHQKRSITGSYDCLLVCNRPVQMRAPPLRRAGISDKVTDDLAYRRFQRVITHSKQPKPEKSQSYLLCNLAFTPSLNVNEYFRDLTVKSEPDVDKDDLSYRNYTQATGAKVAPAQPPFGIPLGPVVKSSSTSYLQAIPPLHDTRPIYRHQETPDVVRDDMAYRNLRKDPSITYSRQNKKYRAVRSLSANIAQLINQHKSEESVKETKAQSMTDIIAALEEQSTEWKNLSQLASSEQVKSPEVSSTDDSTPHFITNNICTSDGCTLSESPNGSKSPKKETQEIRTQPEGSDSLAKVSDTDKDYKSPINNRPSLVDCCRLMSVNRDSRTKKSMSVYQPSVSSPPPLRYQDVWSDTDVKMKRRTIALDENQLDALLTSLSRDTKQSNKNDGGGSLKNTSNYVDVRVTA